MDKQDSCLCLMGLLVYKELTKHSRGLQRTLAFIPVIRWCKVLTRQRSCRGSETFACTAVYTFKIIARYSCTVLTTECFWVLCWLRFEYTALQSFTESHMIITLFDMVIHSPVSHTTTILFFSRPAWNPASDATRQLRMTACEPESHQRLCDSGTLKMLNWSSHDSLILFL